MRLVGSFKNDLDGRAFSNFLKQEGITNTLEIHPNTDWNSEDYGTNETLIWIEDEDQYPAAEEHYQNFKESLTLPKSNSTSSDTKPINKKIKNKDHPLGSITKALLLICTFLLIISNVLTPSNAKNNSLLQIVSSPVQKKLLYDYPTRYALIDEFIQMYGIEGLEITKNLSIEGQQLLRKINYTPMWNGYYSEFEGGAKIPKDESQYMFEKIKKGEIWRLFTPALLHADIFHLFFNMLWLIVLGKQMEQKLTGSKYILFLLICGIFSNTVQYLMTGPNFLGFSGILCAMLTFIWARKEIAPWEGYQLQKSTFYFMMIFIFGMMGLQFLSVLIEKSLNITIPLSIANSAHLSGALIGYILGRINFFSWRVF